MQISLEEYAKRFPNRRPPPVPLDYAGKWIAWNDDHSEIVASASSFREIREMASQRGCLRPVFHKVPKGIFIGRA